MYRDTDGYIIIDLKGIDVSRASQSVPGLYEKVEPVLDANKLVIVNNAGNHTPLPGSCIKSSNYIRITTDIYIFTINSNNILIIEANGSSITVDVSIIPAYSEGTKIADFEINGQSGELYIPAYPDIINDSVASDHTVYSSDKVNTLLSGKADTSAIPTKTSQLTNDSGFVTSDAIPTKTSDLTNDSGFITDADVPVIDDTTTSATKVWSSDKTNSELLGKQNKLTAGSNITISGDTISAKDTTYTAGKGIDITSDQISVDITAADIPYSAGVSVADKLDSLSTVDIYTLTSTCIVYRVGKLCTLVCIGSSIPANTGSYATRHVLGTLPSGYRPPTTVFGTPTNFPKLNSFMATNAGEVSVRNADTSNASDCYVTLTYIATD